MAMNGTDLLILVNIGTIQTPIYQAVGCQRDCTIEETSETIDVSCKDSRAQRVLSGRYASTISLDSLYIPNDSSYLALRTANRAGDLIKVVREEAGVSMEMVDAKIDSMSEAFPDQGEATISMAFTVDGFWQPIGS